MGKDQRVRPQAEGNRSQPIPNVHILTEVSMLSVSDDWVTNMLQVTARLMGPSGFQEYFDERKPPFRKLAYRLIYDGTGETCKI